MISLIKKTYKSFSLNTCLKEKYFLFKDEFYDDLDLNDDEINELLSHTIYIDDDHHHDENEEEEEEEDDDEEEMNSSEDISLLPNENKEDCQPKHLFKVIERSSFVFHQDFYLLFLISH
jgi:hypothetical protein